MNILKQSFINTKLIDTTKNDDFDTSKKDDFFKITENIKELIEKNLKLLPLDLEKLSMISIIDIEDKILTDENRKLSETYLLNINEDNREYILDVINTLKKYKGKPLSNAFYIHELQEYFLRRNMGNDYITQKPPKNTILDPESHYNSVLVHCYYLFLLAREKGYNLSLESIIEFDPIGDRHSKDILLGNDDNFTSLDNLELEKDSALKFFSELIKEENYLCNPYIFGIPPANNIEPYMSLFKN